MRWVRNLNLTAGRYRFTVIADDGVRLWVNNILVIDQWRVQPATRYTVEVDVAGGAIPIKMEYFENTERAEARLGWERVSVVTPPPSSAWRAEYYNNMNLGGQPVVVRDETAVNYNWGYGTPAPQVPVDNFSARWTTNLSLAPGRYRFAATSDDGVHVHNDLVPLVPGGDCEVFQDPETGLFCMLRSGVDRLVSSDLRHWEHVPGEFLTLGEGISHECPNHFEWNGWFYYCLLYTSPSPRDRTRSRMPSSA